MNDHELTAFLAEAAGQRLLEMRASAQVDFTDVDATSALEKSADAASNEFLIEQLRSLRPLDAILSEESPDSDARLLAQRVWIIDPVDGSKEFGRNEPEFAIHVALWEKGALVAGAVAVPNADMVWSTGDVAPLRQPLHLARPLVVVASSREKHSTIERLEHHLGLYAHEHGFAGVSVMHCGSVGGKVHQLLQGVADVYVSTAGFFEWDSAAPTVVAQHYGFVVTDVVGHELTFNQMPPRTESFVVTHSWLHETVINALRGL
jgi:3'(2'), 5'-bisphosphate nucleotidase